MEPKTHFFFGGVITGPKPFKIYLGVDPVFLGKIFSMGPKGEVVF